MSLIKALVRRLHPQHNLIRQATPFLRRTRLSRAQPKRFLEGVFEFGLDLGDLARELPADLRRILSQITTGAAKLIFKHDRLEPLISSCERVSYRVADSIVLAALIIGSSVMVHADIPPRWNGIPIIGLIGFVLAAVIGFWLLVSSLRHGRM